MNMQTPAELAQTFIKAGENKVNNTLGKFFVLCMMAGAFIAIGGSSSSLACHAVQNPGLAKLVSGCIFPVGLMLIVFIGGELFTGDCMMIMGCIEKKYSALKMISRLCIVLLGNLVGALLIVAFVYISGQWDMSAGGLGAFTIKVAYGKSTMGFMQAMCSGIMCNILVCAAVLMGAAAKDASGKVWAIFFPIMAFVVGGYEHCVANMYYIPAGMVAASNASYLAKAEEMYGLTKDMVAQINIGNFLWTNLVPVILGNVIGGMVFISLPLLFTTKQKQ